MIPQIYAKLLEPHDIEPLLINIAKTMFSNGIDFYIDEEGSFKSDIQGVRSNNPLINKHNDLLLYMAEEKTMPSLSAYVSEEYPKSLFPKFLRAWKDLQEYVLFNIRETNFNVSENGIQGPNFFIFSANPVYELSKILSSNEGLSLVHMEFRPIEGTSYIEDVYIQSYFKYAQQQYIKIILPYNLECKIILDLIKSYQ